MTKSITWRCLLKLVFGDCDAPPEQIVNWLRSTVRRDSRDHASPGRNLSRPHVEIGTFYLRNSTCDVLLETRRLRPAFPYLTLAARDGKQRESLVLSTKDRGSSADVDDYRR